MSQPAPSSPARLVVEHVTKHFALRSGFGRTSSVVHAVDDVTLCVEAGKTLAIVGESGCGKSTLARCIVGLTPVTSGRILLDGENIAERAVMTRKRRAVQLVSQNALSALNRRRTVGDALMQAMQVHDLGGSNTERAQRAGDLLEQVGLRREFANRFPSGMSGGELQRVIIARSLAVEPSVLVLDEPTASLDVSVKAKIVNLLLELQAQLGLTYVMITHEIDIARHVSDRVAIMYLGRLAEDASIEQVVATPRHPYSQLLLGAQPHADTERRKGFVGIAGEVPSAVDPPDGCRFNTRCPLVVDRCRTEVPQPVDVGGGQLVSCHRRDEHLVVGT